PTGTSRPRSGGCSSPPRRGAWSGSPLPTRTTTGCWPTSRPGSARASCTPRTAWTTPPASSRSTSPAPAPGSTSRSTSPRPGASAARCSSTCAPSSTGTPRATPRSPGTSEARARSVPSARRARPTPCRSSCPATGCCAATAAWAATSAGSRRRRCCSTSSARPEGSPPEPQDDGARTVAVLGEDDLPGRADVAAGAADDREGLLRCVRRAALDGDLPAGQLVGEVALEREDAGRQVDVGDEARAAACADLLPVAEQGVLEDVAVPCARAEQRVLDGGDLPYPVRPEVLEEEVRQPGVELQGVPAAAVAVVVGRPDGDGRAGDGEGTDPGDHGGAQ